VKNPFNSPDTSDFHSFWGTMTDKETQTGILGMVAHACNPSTWEVEAGGIRGQPELPYLNKPKYWPDGPIPATQEVGIGRISV
jgi:hypothetical protein